MPNKRNASFMQLLLVFDSVFGLSYFLLFFSGSTLAVHL